MGLLLSGRRVLVVGGGTVATRRIPALLAARAEVLLVAPVITPALRALADAGRLHWRRGRFEPSDLDGAWLVQVAVDDPSAAAQVSAEALARRIFCVRADDRHAATAWTPALTRHGPVTVAVLGGGNPRRAMAVRDRVARLLADPDPVAGDLPAGGTPPAGLPGTGPGEVLLIGAGPGDPELITVRGRRLLARADVVVVDRLAPGLLLDELGADVELIDASKIPYGPGRSQEEINAILVDRARAGRTVARLKGGDPYVFGRGGEELLACLAAGVPVRVVPGVTSAVAVPAAAGIPVTHRGLAHEFVVVSGHLPPGHPDSLVNWPALAQLHGTVCVLMGLSNLDTIGAALLAHGRAGDTPVGVIQEGTTATQRVLRGTLAGIATEVRQAGLRPPAVIVIGAVVPLIPPPQLQ